MLYNKKIIALCTTKIHDRESFELTTSLSKALFPLGFQLFVYTTCSDLFWGEDTELGEASVYKLIDYDITDAVVVFYEKIKNTDIVNEIIDRAKAHGKPVILIEGSADGCYDIRFDYDDGFKSVCRHIITFHGISDVHFIAGMKDNPFSDNRINIFRTVLEENNIPFDESMISYGDFWSEPTEKAVLKLIQEKRVPRAFICANDSMAITACNTLRCNGYRVPEDVYISGFDGLEEVKYSIPQITTCECLYPNLAQKAAQIINDIFSGKGAPLHNITEPSMLIAESCGCGIKKEYNITEHLSNTNRVLYTFRNDEYLLFKTAAKMQMSSSFEEAATYLKNTRLYNTFCILNKRCLDNTINPQEVVNDEPFQDDMILFFDADNAGVQQISDFRKKDIVPSLFEKLQDEYPLVFVSINFQNNTLGYACFHYYNYDIVHYSKIQQNVTSLNNTIIGLMNTRYQLHLAEQIEELYRTDNLTQLYNRTGFYRLYKRLIKENSEIAVVLVDLDGLKFINDMYGHDEGDNAISAVADAVRAVFPDCICGRFGGDEMVIASKEKLDADIIKLEFKNYLDEYNKVSGKPYRVSASIGIYNTNHENSLEFVELLKKADKLMYADKLMKHGGHF